MGEMNRRGFLRAGAGGAGALWLGGSGLTVVGCTPSPAYNPPANGTPFTLGVLSGLHSASEVVLWTRLEPSLAPGATAVTWEIATDPGMGTIVESGEVTVDGSADWTAKVLVGGLAADRSYWYRFAVGGLTSPVGRARTLPSAGSSPDRLRLAFASCQNWGSGWYNAWAGIVAEDVDAVVWLGDYIYESGGSAIASVRKDPVGSVDDLAGYRAKYQLYRSDPLLQAGHAAHPFVPVWDDHEFENDYNRITIAQNPQRAQDAYRAWFEYMPVWPIDGTRIHRSLSWGRLAEIPLLDTRQYRDRQPNGFQGPDVDSYIGAGEVLVEAALPNRTILGTAQRDWLFERLGAAQADGVRWKLIGNQVMIAPVRPIDLDTPELRQLFPDLPRHNGLFVNMDSWDGYQWERDLLLARLADERIADVSFLTGDIHTFWQASIRADFDDPTSPIVANEYVGGSISSSGPNVIDNDDFGIFIEEATRNWSPAFRYSDFRRNGYGLLDATPDTLDISFRTTRVKTLGTPVATSVAFGTTPGSPVPSLTAVNP